MVLLSFWRHQGGHILHIQLSDSKEELKKVLALAKSDRERECLRYAVYRASGLASTAACRYFGFKDMKDRAKHVEDCLRDAQILCEAVEDLSHTQEKAVLRTLGIEVVNSSSDSEAEADSTDESDSEVRFEESLTQFQIPAVPQLVQSHFNWFEILDNINDGCEKGCI